MTEAAISDGALAGLAAAAYLMEASLAAGDVHVVVTESNGITVASFRGTVPTSWEDWLRDLAAWPDRSREHPALGWCHAGFLDGGEDIWPQLQPALEGKRVILTGHSLGGAMAIIAAGLMMEAGTPPEALVTFGAPRVQMGALAKLLAPLPIRQYRHGNDPVTDIPHLYHHVRPPLIDIGQRSFISIECHGIDRYAAMLSAAMAIAKEDPPL